MTAIFYHDSYQLQDRVEGAALLEAAELRGDDSDADLGDSDADSDLELDDSAAQSDAEADSGDAEAPEAVELSGDELNLTDLKAQSGLSDSGLEAESGSDSESEDGEDRDADGDQLASDEGVGRSDDSDVELEEEDAEAGPSSSKAQAASSGSPSQHADSAAQEGESDLGSLPSTAAHSDQEEEDEEVAASQREEEAEEEEHQQGRRQKDGKPKLQPAADSLQSLKRKLAAVKGAQAQGDGNSGEAGVPIEWGRVLTAEDFERIKELRHK